MSQMRLLALLGIVLAALLTAVSAVYTVDEREKALVVRLGEVIRYDDRAGLHFKTPFLDEVRSFDARILTMDADPQPFLTKEKKYVVVDSYAKWRVVDPLKYFLTVSGREFEARRRLEQMINSSLRDEFNKRNVQSVVSVERSKIMEIATKAVDKEARAFGIEVVDVRLQRVDLPEEVSQSVYQRMKAERSRIANELRAQGAEAAETIKAEAERKRDITVAEAYRQAQRTRGEGEARATSIYGSAANTAPEFYSLYRSLNAYKESFRDKDDLLIVDPSSDFFRYMKKPAR